MTKNFDSINQREADKARIREENKVFAEDKEIGTHLPMHGETRDQLLARIRKMREEPPPPPEKECYRSPGLQKQFEAEQEMGRAMVAKAQAEIDAYRAVWQQEEAEGEKKSG